VVVVPAGSLDDVHEAMTSATATSTHERDLMIVDSIRLNLRCLAQPRRHIRRPPSRLCRSRA
jgi:hypothetical protein